MKTCARLHVRISNKTAAAIRNAALRDKKSISDYVRKCIVTYEQLRATEIKKIYYCTINGGIRMFTSEEYRDAFIDSLTQSDEYDSGTMCVIKWEIDL